MTSENAAAKQYDQLGGWLIIPAILHPVAGIVYSIEAAAKMFPLFSDKLPFGTQIFVLSIGLGAVALAIGWLAALYHACSINPFFPKFYIWMMAISIAGPLAANAISFYAYNAGPDESDWKVIAKAFAVACVWVPYILVSKRVKATFYGIPFPSKAPQ